jgi:hypothetical protein
MVKRGFGAMSPEDHRRIASMGGKAVAAKGTGHRWDSCAAKSAAAKAAASRRAKRARAA